MKSIFAGVIAITFHIVGFAIGCGIWAVIGWCLGTVLNHAPITGTLTGIAYQLGSYIMLHEQMWAHLQRSHSKVELVLDRVLA